MKFKTKFTYFLLGLILFYSPAEALDGTITKIVNGSTLSFYTEVYKGYVSVRLPDIKVADGFSDLASTTLEQYALGKHCKISTGLYDKAFILIAKVTCDGVDLRTILLEKGYVLIPSGTSVEQSLVDRQNIAQKTDAGVWKGINEKARKRKEHWERWKKKQARIKAEAERLRKEVAARKEEERQEKIRRQAATRTKTHSYDRTTVTKTRSTECKKADAAFRTADRNYDALRPEEKTAMTKLLLAELARQADEACGD